MKLSKLLIKHEGMELKPYSCTEGKTTIGVGRNLDDVGISEDEAMYLLANDIRRVSKELEMFSFARYLNEPRRIAIMNMLFNLGLPRFVKFRLMVAALEEKDYEEAALQMLDSKWANQVGERAIELAEIVRTGSPVNN